jgi:GT2 family glycosyltransferase
MTPNVSVIIPTHNRLPYLLQCLDALAQQRFPQDRMEVVVVADGCTDATEATLSEASYPFPLHVISQPASGANAARNSGAAAARAPLLLFLDDDVIASSGLVEAHVQVHAEREGYVAVGPYLLDEPIAGDFLGEQLYLYWKRIFARMAEPDRSAIAGDVMAGNLSMPAATFAAAGGFDAAFAGALEDHELGVRLLRSGARVIYLPEARARHLETTDLDRSLHRNRRAGSAVVLMVTLHPDTLPYTRLANQKTLARWLVFRAPRLGQALAVTARWGLTVAERLRMRRVWLALYGRTRIYWYWRGVADEVGSAKAWKKRLADLQQAHRQQAETLHRKHD